MMSPCYQCTRRSATCHAECEQYAAYAEYRQKIREARQMEHEANATRVANAAKIRAEVFRKRRK